MTHRCSNAQDAVAVGPERRIWFTPLPGRTGFTAAATGPYLTEGERGSGMPRPATIRFPGRILQLTEDPTLLKQQLAGATLPRDPERKLLDNISTDEITPGWVCYYYDDTLAQYSLVGLRG